MTIFCCLDLSGLWTQFSLYITLFFCFVFYCYSSHCVCPFQLTCIFIHAIALSWVWLFDIFILKHSASFISGAQHIFSHSLFFLFIYCICMKLFLILFPYGVRRLEFSNEYHRIYSSSAEKYENVKTWLVLGQRHWEERFVVVKEKEKFSWGYSFPRKKENEEREKEKKLKVGRVCVPKAVKFVPIFSLTWMPRVWKRK